MEQNEHLLVYRHVCRPFSVLHLKPRTLHRGIPNAADYDRVMLFVSYDLRDGPAGNYRLIEDEVYVEPQPLTANAPPTPAAAVKTAKKK
jgi:hypothetical protein